MTPSEARDYVIRHCNPNYPHEKTERETAVNMAIEALEKQIPEPMMEELDISGRPIRVCGNCGDAPGSGEF